MNNESELITRSFLIESLRGLEERIMAKTEVLVAEKVDNLARIVNQGFMDMEAWITRTMATKEELRAVAQDLGRRIDGLDAHLSAYAGYWDERFEGHDARLKELEKKR